MWERPASIWNPSLNYTPRPNGRDIKAIVLHGTETDNIESPLRWLCDSESKVSSHYLIGLDGKIYHLVHEQHVAWDCGISELDGIQNVNQFSVGIELVHTADETEPYPFIQLDSCADLCAPICKDFGIRVGAVTTHHLIAPARKTDPAGFPLDQFHEMLIARGVGE